MQQSFQRYSVNGLNKDAARTAAKIESTAILSAIRTGITFDAETTVDGDYSCALEGKAHPQTSVTKAASLALVLFKYVEIMFALSDIATVTLVAVHSCQIERQTPK